MAEPHESRVYSDLAHFYDSVFGRIFVDHEREVIESLTLRPGQSVLEVGVGTGIALDAYPPYVRVVGIDPSEKMLAQAMARSKENGWQHVELMTGDALNLNFPDSCFDWVCSFHVMTVVSNPVQMMKEMVRVCKPEGRIVVLTRFASPHPVVYALEAAVDPITRLLGWTSRLRAQDVLSGQAIRMERQQRLSRFSLHTVVVARKQASG